MRELTNIISIENVIRPNRSEQQVLTKDAQLCRHHESQCNH